MTTSPNKPSPSTLPPRKILLAIFIGGVLLRVLSVFWNAEAPHGDVHLDTVTLHSLWNDDGFQTPLGRSVEMYPPLSDSVLERPTDGSVTYPADQHPPLILVLAYPFRYLGASPYLALQLVTLLAGLALIFATWRVALRLFDEERAALAAALVAGSFLLADFSGNGSIYILQALWLVLAIGALSRPMITDWIVGGICIGLAWLTNYQALVAVPAAILTASLTRDPISWRLGRIAGLAVGFIAVAWMWWVRNLTIFGDPLFSVNPIYMKAWLGASLSIATENEVDVLQVGPLSASGVLRSLKGILVVNTRMLVAQGAWWIGPLLSAGAVGAVCAVTSLRDRKRSGLSFLVWLAAAQVAVLILWPAAKFRYLVPILPLFALLAASVMRGLPSAGTEGGGAHAARFARWAGYLAIAAVALVGLERLGRGAPSDGAWILIAAGCLVTVGAVAVFRNRPTWILASFLAGQIVLGFAARGSTYYDGILIGDTFGRRNVETADRARQRSLEWVAEKLVELRAVGVIATIELKHPLLELGAQTNVIQPFPEAWAGDRERAASVVRRVMNRHGVDHALAFSEDEARLYEASAQGEVVARSEEGEPLWILLGLRR